MYERFFQLTSTPFSLVSDPERIHFTAQHEEVIRSLAFGVGDRRGFMILAAEPGLGKTTVLRALSHLLIDSSVYVSTILNPTLTSSEFLELLMINLGFKEIPSSKARRLKLLEDFLVRSDAAGRLVTLIVDEAHRLSDELLEEIRLLGNFEGVDRKLFQIILAGQNELSDRLNLPQLWQFKQRIAKRLALERLDRASVEEYIQFRWSEAGGAAYFPFTDAVLDAIFVWSSGIPRLINSICDNALVIAFSETTYTLDVEMVREACTELLLPTPAIEQQRRSPSRATAAGRVTQYASESANQFEPSVVNADEKSSFVARWLHRASVPSRHQGARTGASVFSLNERRS